MKHLSIDMQEYQYRLLPCPFCGSETQSLDEIDEEDEWLPPKIVLTCTGCGAQHFSFECDSDEPMDEAIEDVIRLWNRRTIERPGSCPECGSPEVMRAVEVYIGDSGTHHKCIGYCCDNCGRETPGDRSEYRALRNWYTGGEE